MSPDADKALECIRKAAELRLPEAMAALGVMLLHERGEIAAVVVQDEFLVRVGLSAPTSRPRVIEGRSI